MKVLKRIFSHKLISFLAAIKNSGNGMAQRDFRKSMLHMQKNILDLKSLMARSFFNPEFLLLTDYPLALYSDDFRSPRGSMSDDTRSPKFVQAALNVFGITSYLDLGCAGGGLVFDFLMAGYSAFGIDGSNYGKLNQNGHWNVIPHALAIADITEKFEIKTIRGESAKFSLIGAWEVLEHIPEEKLPGLFANIYRHLNDEGYFMASVAQFPDSDPITGSVWHVTIKDKTWWCKKFKEFGFEICDLGFPAAAFPRGSGNDYSYDWNVAENSTLGFHIVLKKSSDRSAL